MSDITGLKYLGANGSPYIVGIPARDLNLNDLIWIAYNRGVSFDEVVSYLAQDTIPVLYKIDNTYTCESCGKQYKSWGAYHKHVLGHTEHPKNQTPLDSENEEDS